MSKHSNERAIRANRPYLLICERCTYKKIREKIPSKNVDASSKMHCNIPMNNGKVESIECVYALQNANILLSVKA